MPYKTVLVDGRTANDPAGITTCLMELRHNRHNTETEQRISLIIGDEEQRQYIGHPLKVARFEGGRVCATRWWEKDKFANNQQILPLSMFEPAKINSVHTDRYGSDYSVDIEYYNDYGEYVVLTARHNGNRFSTHRNGIRAIKLHRLVRRIVEEREATQEVPFASLSSATLGRYHNDRIQLATQEVPFASLSSGNGHSVQNGRGCVNNYTLEQQTIAEYHIGLARQAVRRDGIVVTLTGDVYNSETGEFIGSNFREENQNYNYTNNITPNLIPFRRQFSMSIPYNTQRYMFLLPSNSAISYTYSDTYQPEERPEVRDRRSRDDFEPMYSYNRRLYE